MPLTDEERIAARQAAVSAVMDRKRAKVQPGQAWRMPRSKLGRTVKVTGVSGNWVHYDLIAGSGPDKRRVSLVSFLASYKPVPEQVPPRLLSTDERLMARHLLQELRETAASVRNAIEPATGVLRITDEAWREQWKALTRNLDYFTDEVVGKGKPASPYGRI